MSQIECDAKQLLSDLALFQIPINPIEVCRKLGVAYDEKPYENFDGTLIVKGNWQLIGVNSKIVEPGRKAFTCAHEIGHYQYDVTTSASFTCTRDDVGYGKTKTDAIEIRANDFASELLMPRDLFYPKIRDKDPSWELLKDLSQKFQTSLQAATNRFVKLSHHMCWLLIVKDGVIWRYTKAEFNDFAPQVKKTFKAPTSDPGTFRETYADSWFYENRNTKNKKLLFWPLPKNRYGECPVLLWDRKMTLLNDDYSGDEFDDEMEKRDDEI